MSGLPALCAVLFWGCLCAGGGAASGVQVHEMYLKKDNMNRSVACGVCEGRGGYLARQPYVTTWELLFGNLSHLKDELFWVDLVKTDTGWAWGDQTALNLSKISSLPMTPAVAANYSQWSCAVWSMVEPFLMMANCSMPASILCQLPPASTTGCNFREITGQKFNTIGITITSGGTKAEKKECLKACSTITDCWAADWNSDTKICRLLKGPSASVPPPTPQLLSHGKSVVFGKACMNFTEMSPEDSEFICNCGAIELPSTEKEKEDFLEEHKQEVKKELIVPTETLSATIRKKESAPDERPSSTSIGYLGVTMMVLVFGGLVLMDLTSLLTHVKIAAFNIKTAIVHEEENASEA
ncbi:hypothetical protein ACOMHN_032392 [Nucella lapillus]